MNYYLGAAAIATLWFAIKVIEGEAKLNNLEKADEGEQG
jgi:hypothetical protein